MPIAEILTSRSTFTGESLSCTTVATRRSLDTVKAAGIRSLQNRVQVSVSGVLVKRLPLQRCPPYLSPHKRYSQRGEASPLRGIWEVGARTSPLVAELAPATRRLTVLRCKERGIDTGLNDVPGISPIAEAPQAIFVQNTITMCQ